MLSVAQFYSSSHRGNAFGVRGPLYGASGHRGDDTNGWASGTAIPSFVSGTVVRAERQVGLGWVVTVYSPRLPGTTRAGWVSFCHEQAASVGVGKRIYVGSYVGPVGNTGTLSLGPHVHVVVSYTSSDPAKGSVVDPRPFINASKLTPAGQGVSLLEDDPTAPIKPRIPEDDMLGSRYITRATGPGNARQWAHLNVVLPDGYEVTQDVKVANGWAAFDPTGGLETDDAHWQPTLDTAKRLASLYWQKMGTAGGSGVPVDFSQFVGEITDAAELGARSAINGAKIVAPDA